MEHLQLFGGIKGLPSDDVQTEATWLVKLVGLQGKETNKSTTLSGGQKRKLSVALALIGSPKLVVLDEPVTRQRLEPQTVERLDYSLLT